MTTSLNLTKTPTVEQTKYFTFETTKSFYANIKSSKHNFESIAAKVCFVALPFIAAVEALFELLATPFIFLADWLNKKPVVQPEILVEANNGDALAQYEVAGNYQEGTQEGFSKDLALARKYYKLAMENPLLPDGLKEPVRLSYEALSDTPVAPKKPFVPTKSLGDLLCGWF